jgi:hypothetical protein
MFGSFMRVVAVIAVVAVLAGIGIGIYNAGVSEGLAEAARAAQAAGEDPAVVVPPYAGPYGYGWGHGWGGPGFGIFGFLFFIIFLFLIFGLVRAAFGWGRWGGGGRGPGGWGGGGREERIAEYHRELHKRDAEPSTG